MVVVECLADSIRTLVSNSSVELLGIKIELNEISDAS